MLRHHFGRGRRAAFEGNDENDQLNPSCRKQNHSARSVGCAMSDRSAKITTCVLGGNHGHLSAHPPHGSSVSRSSRTWRRGAVAIMSSGAFARRRLRMWRTAKPCGPDTPTLVSSLLRRCCDRAGDGGLQARCTRGSIVSPQTIAQGGPGLLGRSCRSAACFLLHADHGAPPAPVFPCALPLKSGSDCKARTQIAPRNG
jgi:hypothetical protein